MKAIRYGSYGTAQVLRLADVDMPDMGDEDVLVRVRAAAVNPLDVHMVHGTPYLLRLSQGLARPKSGLLGVDLAGQVEAVGRNVTRFRPGDDVFGALDVGRGGAFAEYVSIGQGRALSAKPAGLTYVQAASIPVAGVTALQALRDKGGIQAGHRVLVNGASGGVGTIAVQVAKAYGAEVTGVCGAGNAELVRALGADHVIDYTSQDFTRQHLTRQHLTRQHLTRPNLSPAGQRYDIVVDMVGNHRLADIKQVLTPRGVLVAVGGPRWVGNLTGPIKMFVLAPFTGGRVAPLMASATADDLARLRELVDADKIAPVIDRIYPLRQAQQAVAHVEQGHARGKVVMTV